VTRSLFEHRFEASYRRWGRSARDRQLAAVRLSRLERRPDKTGAKVQFLPAVRSRRKGSSPRMWDTAFVVHRGRRLATCPRRVDGQTRLPLKEEIAGSSPVEGTQALLLDGMHGGPSPRRTRVQFPYRVPWKVATKGTNRPRKPGRPRSGRGFDSFTFLRSTSPKAEALR
jgi:hypothetical protein